mmetsp:Transcript_46021/g.86272  ORF Transcript_46021/g.86272 Transcript_46021/m.86272 type:complete len:221 (+) Transcript_46021:403-1065(+)
MIAFRAFGNESSVEMSVGWEGNCQHGTDDAVVAVRTMKSLVAANRSHHKNVHVCDVLIIVATHVVVVILPVKRRAVADSVGSEFVGEAQMESLFKQIRCTKRMIACSICCSFSWMLAKSAVRHLATFHLQRRLRRPGTHECDTIGGYKLKWVPSAPWRIYFIRCFCPTPISVSNAMNVWNVWVDMRRHNPPLCINIKEKILAAPTHVPVSSINQAILSDV